MKLEPTDNFEFQVKRFLTNREKLLLFEILKETPLAGTDLTVDGKEFDGLIKFIRFPESGSAPTRRGHFLKVIYALYLDEEKVLLIDICEEANWERWLSERSSKELIVAGARGLVRVIISGPGSS